MSNVTNYNQANELLQGRNKEQRKIANNTYLHRIGDNIALKLHNTDVVTFTPKGDKILNSGGWHTSTTKERINSTGVRLYQEHGNWYISGVKFADGMTIKSDGAINGGIKDNPKADRQFKAKVKEYAKLYANALPLDKPSGGDCWMCYMITQDKQTLGDATKDNHLDSHMEEGYIVPSLAYNALKEAGNTDMIISLVFNNPEHYMFDLAKERIYKAVYKYILKRKGYAV